jgi:hypothetical protein
MKFKRGRIKLADFEPVNSKEKTIEFDKDAHLFMKTFSHINLYHAESMR